MNILLSKSLAAEAPVWFITDCSTGSGLEFAKQAIEHGYRTVVAARDPSKLQIHSTTDNVLVLQLDVTKSDEVKAAIKATVARFGRIDVLVNYVGSGYFAGAEEREEDEVRKIFDVNVFGTGRMVLAVLPGMRAQRSGCIINLSSLGGLRGFPAQSYYNATKLAVESLSAVLRQEVESLGIQVMVVEPSSVRTDSAGRSANDSEHQIDDYMAMATAGAVRAAVRASSGKQLDDPLRAGKAIVAAVVSGRPPHH